jgi:hypothetical protein
MEWGEQTRLQAIGLRARERLSVEREGRDAGEPPAVPVVG